MDANNDDQLDLEEFRTGLGMLGMDQDFAHILFTSFDTDRSGAINKSEFLAAMAVMLHPTDMEQQISMAFDAYDRNRDGVLTIDEFMLLMAALRRMWEAQAVFAILDINHDRCAALAHPCAALLPRCE